MSAIITIEFVPGLAYIRGDYAHLHGNSGSGAVNWNAALDNAIYKLFAGGGGLMGFGCGSFGHHRFGYSDDSRSIGFGHLPFGRYPFGHGSAVIRATDRVDYCGAYIYGLAAYDECGNIHEGDPDEVTIYVHIPPPAPVGFLKNSYDKVTDILILDVAA